MKKIILGLIILIAVSFSMFFIFNKTEKIPKYKTEEITKGDITETVTASGIVNPVISISVGTQVSGTLKELYVDFNSPVKKGQLLAQIDPSLFEAQVEQARANLYNAQANLQKIHSIMVNDEKTYSRYSSLYKKNFVAKSEVDLAEANYNSSKAQIASAKAQIAQANAALRNNLTNLRYTKIISPVDGIVISRNVDIGQTVAASFQTPTLFLVAQDLTKMQIDTSVAEADIGKIITGQDVEYTLDGYPDMTFKGKVKQIRIAPTTVQNVVTYDVVISVDNKDLRLKPGMTANVSIITSKKKNIIMIPNACLRFTPFEGKNAVKFKDQGIWILGDNEPVRISIKTGVSDGNYTEIMSKKAVEGQKVITEKIEKTGKNKSGAPRMRMF
jgi:HlyD family secretion protein